jgi:hypothetical protein
MFKQHEFSLCAGTVAFVLGTVFSTTAFAADGAQIGAGSTLDPAAVHKAQAARQPLIAAAQHFAQNMRGVVTAPGTTAAEIFPNPYRAYPESCLVDGMPLGQSSLYSNVQQRSVTLQAYNTSVGGYSPETDTLIVWRVPCSGGAAAVVVEIDRPAAVNGNATQYPVFPNIYITQSGTTAIAYPRVAQEPNTLFEDMSLASSVYYSTIYVLEYYNPANARSSPQVDYSQAFTLNIDNLASGGAPATLDIPAYVAATSPPPMAISGYMTANWSNPNQSGEGIILQVYNGSASPIESPPTRILSFAWFTYDDSGAPFWLFGSGTFTVGATSVTAQTIYLTGGTFAASSPGPAVNTPSWGSVTFTFPDCAHMNIVYSGDASAVNGPKGAASATFSRVADVNSLVCQ